MEKAPDLTRKEKELEKHRLIFNRGGFRNTEYVVHNATRYEEVLKKMFYNECVWVTVKGKRRLGIVKPTHMKFITWHEISGNPIFECDVRSVEFPKTVIRMNSEEYNLELDIEQEE